MTLVLAPVLSTVGTACSPNDPSQASGPASEPTSCLGTTVAAPSLEEYLQLHNVLKDPSSASWTAAVERLGAVGDPFTVTQLDALAKTPLDAEQRKPVDSASAAVRGRWPAETPEVVRGALVERLERAALADIRCDALERSLTPWALASIRTQLADPGVRRELERVRDGYQPSTEVSTAWSMLSARVIRCANELLVSDAPVAQSR